jgi:ubiquinone/menaquinone biosynthesis C-methylase UbiE
MRKRAVDTTRLFCSKVDNYAKYRPSYPSIIISVLEEKCGLSSSSRVADVGAGTGNLSRLFLQNGNQVIGIEPNFEMCFVGKVLLSNYPRFRNIIATAEETALPDHSVDFVSAGQAFHWFDARLACREFIRITKPKGGVVLIWNIRQSSKTAFARAYEDLCVRYGVNYDPRLQREPNIGNIRSFFAETGYSFHAFDNQQLVNFDGLKGRFLSSSYIPGEGDPNYMPMLKALKEIYERHQSNGTVHFDYETRMYFGQLSR